MATSSHQTTDATGTGATSTPTTGSTYTVIPHNHKAPCWENYDLVKLFDNRYLGIWYKTVSVQTVVWVANREVGVNDATSVLKLTSSGTLNLYNNINGVIIWSSDSKRLGVNPVLQLFDNGNLVVREKNDNDPAHYLWQSFDYPTDTHLPGMKLGMDLRTGFERFLSSWKSNDDPAPGVYNYHLDPAGYPHLVLRNDKAVGLMVFVTLIAVLYSTSGSLASTYHGWAAVAVAVLVVENLIAALLQPAFNAQHFSSFQCYLT
ncbi:hypothetical protein POM88_031567 [Heracleum sosnowskyi]|uniref:Bulb-type lectin domain-containing protein n=1 Tax=Heracleum sosnowskyi TaxID=360622 RepID=A0AAD8HYW7_9APIA|nr:hypothetical protein POM88_031567 [Heracleum sosnowskyi]